MELKENLAIDNIMQLDLEFHFDFDFDYNATRHSATSICNVICYLPFALASDLRLRSIGCRAIARCKIS